MRGSLTGSVVSNILLVLGAAMIAGGDGKVDARSLRWQLAAVLGSVALLLVVAVPSWHGRPERHSLYLLSIPVSIVLLLAYVVITVRNLRIHRAAERTEASHSAWSLRKSLLLLGDRDARDRLRLRDARALARPLRQGRGLNEFFIAVVIVAIVGNAAEHGGAIVIAHRGNTTLATEIAVTSSMQVALFVTPAVCLLSAFVGRGLPLSFRMVEIFAMAAAAAFATIVIWDGRSRRWEGFLLVGVYVLAVGMFFAA